MYYIKLLFYYKFQLFNIKQFGRGFTERNSMFKNMKDIPLKICVFGDIILVLYLSGIILKFYVTVSPAKLDQRSKIVTFSLRHRFECLVGMSPSDMDHIQISHGAVKIGNYPEGCTRIYCKLSPQQRDEEDQYDDDEDYSDEDECEEAGIWVLEDNERLIALDGVDQIYDIRRIGDDDYCLLSRNYDTLDEYDLDMDDMRGNILFPTKYLELWRNDECVRTLKVKGLEDAKMNGFCVVVVSYPGLFQPASMVRFNLADFKNILIRSMDLVPAGIMNVDKIPTFLYLSETQIMWSVPFEGFEKEKDGCFSIDDDEENEFHCINSLNFWYALHHRDFEKRYPRSVQMGTMVA